MADGVDGEELLEAMKAENAAEGDEAGQPAAEEGAAEDEAAGEETAKEDETGLETTGDENGEGADEVVTDEEIDLDSDDEPGEAVPVKTWVRVEESNRGGSPGRLSKI